MADLVVIVPSRGRPEAARALGRSWMDTHTANSQLVFAVDQDDPTLDGYSDRLSGTALIVCSAESTMVRSLNDAARIVLERDQPFAIGFMGDDHLPRTVGWDERYLAALRDLGTGIAYGNDLLQGHRLPTQCAMTSDIIQALGYMAPPVLRHLAVDNWWLELGRGADCIRYLADVIIEHRHPLAGKAAWDEGYQRVNSAEVAEHDMAELVRLRQQELPAAIDAVKALRVGVR